MRGTERRSVAGCRTQESETDELYAYSQRLATPHATRAERKPHCRLSSRWQSWY